MTGTAPPGVSGEQSASNWVRGMFGRIAGHYDLLNHLLSFNMDRRWRARTVEKIAPLAARADARVLDLCCGTGDLLLAIEARTRSNGSRPQPIMGSDFCHPMLAEAQRKIADRKISSPLFEADALSLPLADGSLDLITVAFGFRNLANYRRGMQELWRVLKPGGVVAILEFSQPTNRAFGMVYGFFSAKVLPWVGGVVSGSHDAYSYLPESIRRFPGAEELAAELRAANFSHVEFERMTGGAVALHLARK